MSEITIILLITNLISGFCFYLLGIDKERRNTDIKILAISDLIYKKLAQLFLPQDKDGENKLRRYIIFKAQEEIMRMESEKIK